MPASSTLNTTCVRSGGGGSFISSGGVSSGTRTPISFSISGVSTMKMIRSTSTTSTSGVMLMSERGPFLAPTSMPILAPALQLFGGERDALELGLGGEVHHRPDLAVLGLHVGLEHQPLAWRLGHALHVREQLLLGRGLLLLLDE